MSILSRDPIVVIGGGVAGLTAANLLARNGCSVTLFEAADKLGGCCATTTLDGYTFNDGAIYLGLISVLDHNFSRIGIDRSERLPLRKITAKYSATLPDGTVVTLGEGLDLKIEGRFADLDRVRAELRAMLDKWRPVLRFAEHEILTHPFTTWNVLKKGWRHLHKLRGNLADEFNHLFSDDAVKAALSGDLLYGGLPADAAPVSAILGLVMEIDDGFYLPEGGMGRIPEVLGCALQSQGGSVSLSSTVGQIIVKGGRVRGVRVCGRDVDAAAVVSTTSAMSTYGLLMESQYVPASASRRLKRARLSHRAVSIQLGLSNRIDVPAHTVSVLPWMEQQRAMFAQDGSEMKFPVFVFPSLTLPDVAPAGGSTVEMFYPVRGDLPLDYWTPERKEHIADLAIEALRRRYDANVAVLRIRSPKDFRDGMRLYDGALYGLSPSATPREQFPHDSGIAGLFLAGQTTFPGYGVGAAMMSGIFAAEALLAQSSL